MGEFNVYIGKYLRVWMPKKERAIDTTICLQCKRKRTSTFCPDCGSKIVMGKVKVEIYSHFYDLCSQVFPNEKKFRYVNTTKYLTVIKNGQGNHITFDEYKQGDFPIININAADYDWERLEIALEKQDIKYKEVFGAVAWLD